MKTPYQNELDDLHVSEEFMDETIQVMEKKLRTSHNVYKCHRVHYTKIMAASISAIAVMVCFVLTVLSFHHIYNAKSSSSEAVNSSLDSIRFNPVDVYEIQDCPDNVSAGDTLYRKYSFEEYKKYLGGSPVPANFPSFPYSSGVNDHDVQWMKQETVSELSEGYFGSWIMKFGKSKDDILLHIYVAKDGVYRDHISYVEQQRSNILDTDVLLGFYAKESRYIAEFCHNYMDYFISATCSQQEFLQYIRLIISEQSK